MSRYLEADEQRFAAADEFMDSCLLGKRRRVFGLPGFLREYLGNSNHLWMYDYKLLEHLLKAAGFVDVRRCSFGDSFDPMFALVEQRDRFFDGEHVELAIEAKSP